MSEPTTHSNGNGLIVLLVFLGFGAGGYWGYREFTDIRRDIARLEQSAPRLDVLEQRGTASALVQRSEAALRNEIKALQATLSETTLQVKEAEDRMAALERSQATVTTGQERLANLVEGFKKSRDLLEETSKRIETVQKFTPPVVEKPSPPPTQLMRRVVEEPPRPRKRTALIVVESVRVKSTKANGKDWDDEGGDPDLAVQISCNGDTKTTSKVSDSTVAEFGERLLRVSVGDTIVVKVIDRDALFDDAVATYPKAITNSTLDAKTADWSFGQVESLQLTFEP